MAARRRRIKVVLVMMDHLALDHLLRGKVMDLEYWDEKVCSLFVVAAIGVGG